MIIQPDIYTNPVVCVHGIANVLDYKVYGEPDDHHTPASLIPPPQLPPLPAADDQDDQIPLQDVVTTSMGVVCDCVCFLIRFLAIVSLFLLS